MLASSGPYTVFAPTPATISRKGHPDTFIGDARITASVRGTNGIVHVVDAVVLPPAK